MINLTIKTLDSQDHKFHVPDTFTILELKEHIAEQVNIAVVQQRLIFCGRVMSNETKLADIGIDGKVMHLVQKVPNLATTTSGTSSSTTTNTNSRAGQPGFRGWPTHDPTVLFGAIGIPSEFMHAGELPRLLSASARSHGAGNRVSLAMDLIRRANEILNRLENPRTAGRSTANVAEQSPERPQQTEESSRNVPLESSLQEPPAQESPAQEPSQEPSSMQTQSDSDSLNVSYEVDETFPNTVVVTIDATHHMRMPPGLIRHMQSHMQGNRSHSSSRNVPEPIESEIPPEFSSVNQPAEDQATRTTLPSSATTEQNLRNDRQTSESRSSAAISDRRRLRELIEQLNSLNARLQPFYAQYCQYINDDPHFESAEGENGSQRAQTVFNGVSEVMHYISHVYHAISDLRVAFNRPPPRSFQSRPCLLQGTIVHTAHSVTTAPAGPPPAPSTQQPTSTQTTSTNQSIPSVRAMRIDLTNAEGTGSEMPNVSTSATSTDTNTNVTVDSNTESNNTASEFPAETPPHGVELMFDLTPGSIRIDSVEASFVNPNAPGSSQPTAAVSQPQNSGEHTTNTMQSIDWMDQMIDVISSGVRRPFMPDQPLDWSIPTTSTRTPRVTPRTTDSSSTTNPPSHGFTRSLLDSSTRMDPFLPCSSHHFEPSIRPMVLARRSTQGIERSTSGNSNTTDSSTPTSPNDIRPISVRRTGRPRTRYVPDSDRFLSGIHPILTWGRNHHNNIATTSASNNQATGQGSVADTLAGQIRVGMESAFVSLERQVERDFDRAARNNVQSPSSSALELDSENPANQSGRRPEEVLFSPIGEISYFRSIEGRYLLVDLFLLIARNWNLHDMLNISVVEGSTLVLHPVSRISEALVDFVLDRIMLKQPPTNHNIEAAANRIYLELVPYINIFQCSVPTRTNIDVNASFRRCILHNLRGIVIFCDENRAGASNDIVSSLTIFAEGLLSLIVYCCNNRSVFRLSIAAVMQFLPLPTNLHRFVMDQVRLNIDHYWDNMTTFQMMSLSVVDFIVPFNSDYQVGNTSRESEEQSSNPILPSSEIPNEPLPEVVIGSQEWHNGVPSEWVPVIARDSQRQRRQGTQPPYSDAYLSGMPNKRRKIVTNSKPPQGPLSQIIAKNLENAMGAAGVPIKKEVITNVGADTDVQNAYTERIKKFGRSGLDMHPDFSPERYPNASKFFYDRPN